MKYLMNKSNEKYRFLNCDTQEAVPLKYGEEIAEFIKRVWMIYFIYLYSFFVVRKKD